jgi:ATP-dependent RNA helicase DeaD
MPLPISELALRYMHNPEFITIKPKEITVPNTEQYYYKVHEKDKFDTLCRLLDLHSPDAAIVFARTKRRVDEIFEALCKRGYSAEAIHGDLTQSKRDSVMRKFKKRIVEILVATDVAARGLDIGSVTHIYNFDIPQDPESYVHRIGRTGRIGRSGVAATLVQPRELNHLELIERIIKRKIIHQSVPTLDEAIKGQQRLAAEKILQIIEKEDYQLYKETARDLLESNSATSLLAAALKMLVKEPDSTPVSITADQNWQPKKKHPPRRNQGNSYKPRQASSRTRSGYKKYHKNKKTYNK